MYELLNSNVIISKKKGVYRFLYDFCLQSQKSVCSLINPRIVLVARKSTKIYGRSIEEHRVR